MNPQNLKVLTDLSQNKISVNSAELLLEPFEWFTTDFVPSEGSTILLVKMYYGNFMNSYITQFDFLELSRWDTLKKDFTHFCEINNLPK